MNKIIVIGAGGHAAELDEYIQFINSTGKQFEIVGFLDDNPDSYTRYQFSAKYLGTIGGHRVDPACRYVMGIANMNYRKRIVDRFLNEKAGFATIIHPTAYVSPTAKIGSGVVIAPYVNLGPNAEVGNFTLLNARVSVGHDTKLGEHNFISPNVSFSGFSVVGNENLFGINSATIPGIKVGDKNKIAAGMVLDKPVESDQVVFYRFKEKIVVTNNAL